MTVAGARETETECSDQLFKFLLKARRPDVYRERMNVQHSGDSANPVRLDGPDLSKLDRSELRQLTDLLARATDNKG